MKRTLDILLFTLCIAFCEWTPPIKLESTSFSLVSNLYLDSDQATAVITRGNLANESTLEFGVRAIPNSHSPKHFVLLESKRASGKTKGDGKRLFVAEFAPRVKAEDPCNMEQPSGCFDVFFRESVDSGQTWSDPIRIPRPDMNDAAIRLFPTIVYIKETGRLYLFYRYSLADESNKAIGYVTRPAGSTVFSQERLIFQGRQIMLGIGAGYTFHNGRTTLHLAWREALTALMYTSSSDGITWKAPTKEATMSIEMEYLAFTPVLTQHDHLFLSYIGEDWMGYLLHSKDQGENWSKPIKVMDKSTQQLMASYCEDKVFVAGIRENNFYLSSFDTKTQKVIFEGKIFETLGKVGDPMISCIKIKEGQYKIAVATTTDDPMKPKQAYYSDNEIELTYYVQYFNAQRFIDVEMC
eukprot:TRINITY_DN1904_c0_g1_i3.p1 TRINITY_DN1904_c0_g1~~TRINITY_DN1904_c0_g1_i3.p1  ORF type:complete len:410 (-),score=12.66 TRINITY_DN1904_c0_g1_i3:21-1250(-)